MQTFIRYALKPCSRRPHATHGAEREEASSQVRVYFYAKACVPCVAELLL